MKSHFGILVTVASLGLALAATVSPKPPATPTKGKVVHDAFKNAGKKAGLEIWRVENFQPVPYPKNDYGKFYIGDSYIVLNTKDAKGTLSWDLHFWLGAETTQDESGSAAIMSVELDDFLKGFPVQHREVQEQESELFLSYFKKSGIRYVAGGVASGFKHVNPNDFEKILYHVKGKKNVRVKQVSADVSSMNKGDCFILDVGKEIYVYVGPNSKRVERLKAVSAANQIRDQDHGGRPKVIVCDEYSSAEEMEKFFKTLGTGTPSAVPEQSSAGDDGDFERKEETNTFLYKVSDAKGSLKVDKLNQKNLDYKLLDTNDCFILQPIQTDTYVWKGKKCNDKEKAEAARYAGTLKSPKNSPSWTKTRQIIEGAEPVSFKEYFQNWQDRSEVKPRII